MDKSIRKQAANQTYYRKNREKILAKARKKRVRTSNNIFQLHSPLGAPIDSLTQTKVSKTGCSRSEFILLLPLIVAMTYFLISESVQFYATREGLGFPAYLKAFIGEGLILLFSYLKPETRLLKWVYRSVLVSACVFSLSVVSANTVSESLKLQSERKITELSVQELEHELASKTEIRDRYIKLNRITTASHYEKSLNPVLKQLKSLRENLKKSEISISADFSFLVLVAFRAIVLLGNVLLVHYVSKRPTVHAKREYGI